MTTWVFLAIAAQAIAAVVTYIDRHVLTHGRGIGKPIAYAFYVALLSGFVIVLLPFGVVASPSLIVLELSIINAIAFVVSLFFLYSALKEGHASDVMPVVAAVSAIASFIFASQWLDEHLPPYFLLAAALFIAGTFLISRYRFTRRQLAFVAIAGFLFGFTAFTFKLVFDHTTFINGFFWTRMCDVAIALTLFCVPSIRGQIFHGSKQSSHSTKWIVVGNKALAGLAAILTQLAIAQGSVSIVNAMSGLQFAFLLIIAFIFASYFPKALRGEIEHAGIRHKIFGIGLVILGMAALYIG